MNDKEMIRPKDFGLAQHEYQQFHATVHSHRKTEELLTEPSYWAHVAGKMQMGSEIRVLATDLSWRAVLICTFSQGTVVRLKLIDFTQLDDVEVDVQNDDYEVRLRGMRKWSIVKKDTAEIVQEDIPTKAEAIKALQDFIRALAA